MSTIGHNTIDIKAEQLAAAQALTAAELRYRDAYGPKQLIERLQYDIEKTKAAEVFRHGS